MATLREYFDTDFPRLLNISNPLSFKDSISNTEVITHVHFDFDSNTKFVSCFIYETGNPIEICKAFVNNLTAILEMSKGVEVKWGLPGESLMNSENLIFSGRVFFYSQIAIDKVPFEALQTYLKEKGIYIHYRGPEFAVERSKIEKPLAFISHDSKDKDLYARPIAIGLSKLMCPVWFDEYSLRVGDRLRESIERGIKECKKCVIILSSNFLANSGWTKTEFNSIFTRELIDNNDFILPVWCGINRKEIFEYSPTLADRVGIKFDIGVDEVVRKLHLAITTSPPIIN